MASADRLDFDIELWPLLHRQFVIPRVRLERPSLLLEKGPRGVGNWVFGSQGPSRTQFGRLWVDDGHLKYVDAASRTDIDVNVRSTASGKGDVAPPIDVDGSGR
jgi:uncharacterized protein involved in outer membrane biogenesis